MGKGKPKTPKPEDMPSCERCGVATPTLMLAHTGGFCGPCWQAERQAHYVYVQKHAIVIADLSGGWTADFFSSELVIERDGCYIHTVNWYGKPSQQQVECFSQSEWQHILTSTQTLAEAFSPPQSMMEDLPSYEISIRIDGELQRMQRSAEWRCPDGEARFCDRWIRIHRYSPWLSRLAIA